MLARSKLHQTVSGASPAVLMDKKLKAELLYERYFFVTRDHDTDINHDTGCAFFFMHLIFFTSLLHSHFLHYFTRYIVSCFLLLFL